MLPPISKAFWELGGEESSDFLLWPLRVNSSSCPSGLLSPPLILPWELSCSSRPQSTPSTRLLLKITDNYWKVEGNIEQPENLNQTLNVVFLSSPMGGSASAVSDLFSRGNWSLLTLPGPSGTTHFLPLETLWENSFDYTDHFSLSIFIFASQFRSREHCLSQPETATGWRISSWHGSLRHALCPLNIQGSFPLYLR